jgi:hypothetical protein
MATPARRTLLIPGLLLLLWLWPALAQPVRIDVVETGESSSIAGQVEFLGVEAGEFNPAIWQAGTINLVPDARHPFLSPLNGSYRNIYAPSAVQTADGYRFFYGAWDGIPYPPKDRLYSGVTDPGFSSVQGRKTIVMPGAFGHVCNVNAIRFPDGSFRMFGTVEYSPGKNRPAFFRSDTTGTNWNNTTGEPYTVQAADFIGITGYTNSAGADKFPSSDINGINVMLHEDGLYRLYFADFTDSTTGVGFRTYRASSSDGKSYSYDGIALNQDHRLANDVKKFRIAGVDWYLLGLHFNGANLWYSLSNDGLNFPLSKTLLGYAGAEDRYIVAMGWVVDGEENQPGRRLTGVLYGAGPDTYLDKNKIYARWLQKKLVFAGDNGIRYTGLQSLGPNRQLLGLTADMSGRLEVYSEDGITLLGRSYPVTLASGRRYRIRLPQAVPITSLPRTGISAAGAVLPSGAVDPRVSLITSPDPVNPGPAAYVVQEPLPSTTWLPNSADSQWIAPVQTAISAPGAYVYRAPFLLDSPLPETASLTVKWAAEYSGTNLAINGVRLSPATTYRGSFSTVRISRELVSGTNELDFFVRRSGTTPARTGLRAEVTGSILERASFTTLTLLTTPASQSVKQGANVSFRASAAGSLPLKFQWFKGDQLLTGQTGPELTLTNLLQADSGAYWVRISNPAGQLDSPSAILDVLLPLAPLFGTPELSAPGNFAARIQGEIGDRYRVEISSNLVHWDAHILLTNTSGTVLLSEPLQGHPERFFRVRLE